MYICIYSDVNIYSIVFTGTCHIPTFPPLCFLFLSFTAVPHVKLRQSAQSLKSGKPLCNACVDVLFGVLSRHVLVYKYQCLCGKERMQIVHTHIWLRGSVVAQRLTLSRHSKKVVTLSSRAVCVWFPPKDTLFSRTRDWKWPLSMNVRVSPVMICSSIRGVSSNYTVILYYIICCLLISTL